MIAAAPDRMPTVMVADIDSGESRELSTAARVVPGWQAPNPEAVDIRARDGGRVYATLYRPPPEKGPAPVPVIVRAHPGPTANAPLRLDPHSRGHQRRECGWLHRAASRDDHHDIPGGHRTFGHCWPGRMA